MGQPSPMPIRIPDLPAHPILRPGSRVVRRDDRHLQVGLDPPRRVVLPDVPEIRDLLADLRHATAPTPRSEADYLALDSLVRAGLVVAQHPSRLGSAQFADSVSARLARRADSTLAVLADHACADWAREVADLAATQELRLVSASARSDAAVVLASGEADRDLLDDLMRDGTPFLLLVARADGVEVGPFVDPGRSACHRCVDSHRGANDPRRALIVEQICRQLDELEDEPMDPLLMRWAATWAVRDMIRHLEGDSPSTRATSYVIGPLDPPLSHHWTRHPHCGCSWSAEFSLADG